MQPELSFKVHGLDCAEEVAVLKREVGPVVGGADRLAFDILNGRMTVSGDAAVSPAAVVKAVDGALFVRLGTHLYCVAEKK
jgi:Cd2+/Zn2+-exporting ATPase